ncbi:Abi family protein [Marinospirillum insulare]|uniref:Abi family protein n=1 Tax=Marinospirillum insulare TaxID=217169 RepID=UPI000481902B|nr:Abi family protein [Marinospirillum insulare]
MQPNNIDQTHTDISVARLSSYRAMFRGANDHELYGIYCWNEALSATLFRLISITEVVMRNRFHVALSLHLYSHRSVGVKDSNDWYNQLALPPKSEQKVRKETHFRHRRSGQLRPKSPAPSPNDVVSRMTFGFWPKLLDVNGIPWGQLLPQIVPSHRYKDSRYWSVVKHQDALYARLDLVNRLRNRIAHFEPVWKQGDLYEERRGRSGSPKPSIELPAPSSPAEVIARLKLLHDRITELLKWLSPDRYSDYTASYVESHFNWICSAEGLAAYKQMQPGLNMPLARFKRELNSILARHAMVRVHRKNRPVGTYYPILR